MIDNTLVECLNKCINLLKEKFGGSSLASSIGVSLRTGYAESTDLNFSNAYKMCHFFDKKIDLFIRVNNKK